MVVENGSKFCNADEIDTSNVGGKTRPAADQFINNKKADTRDGVLG